MTTLTEVLTMTRDRLNEATASFWPDVQLTRWINSGLREIARLTETLTTMATPVVTASVQTVAAPTDMLRIHHIAYKPTGQTQIYPLTYRDFQSMDEVWGISQSTWAGIPQFWTMLGFAPTATIMLYPTPTQAGALRVLYYRLPAMLTSGSDVAECPVGWEDSIVDYAEYNALRKDRDPRWTEAKQLFDEHVNQLTALSRRLTDQAGDWGVEGAGFGVPAWLTNPGY